MNDLIKHFSKHNFITNWKFKEISGYYELDNNQLLTKYNDLFVETFRHAVKNSKFYTILYREHGISLSDIKDITDITKLPIIDKHLIKNQVNNIYNGFGFIKGEGLTSGTSGSPLTVFRTPVNIATEHAYIRHYRGIHGYNRQQPLLSIRGALGKNKLFEFNKFSNTLYISSPNINSRTIDQYYKIITDFSPVAVEAFPSYLYKLFLEMEKKNYKLEIPNAFTSSETLYAFQRESIEAYFKMKIHDWYGNAERSICIAQDSEGRYYPLPLYSVNEFQENRIITTSLINKNFPLIRYAVDDSISVTSNDFLENLVSPKILNIQGRTGDFIELEDGSWVGCIDHAFKGIDNLECAQVHQYSIQQPLEIKLIVDAKFSKDDENRLSANFIRMVGENTAFSFTYCRYDDLTFSANQKYKLVIKHM